MHKIRQKLADDCGVACLAMFAGVSYDAALTAFTQAGLHVPRGRKAAFSSNFKELSQAARELGQDTHMKRFAAWEQVITVAIVKVMRRRNGNWHWVIAHRNGKGIAIYDPDIDLMSYSYPVPGEDVIDFNWYTPCGNIIVPDTPK